MKKPKENIIVDDKLTVRQVISHADTVTVYIYSKHTGKRIGGGFLNHEQLSRLDFERYADCYVDKMIIQNYRLNLIIFDK